MKKELALANPSFIKDVLVIIVFSDLVIISDLLRRKLYRILLLTLHFLWSYASSGSSCNYDWFFKEVSCGSVDVFSGNDNFSCFEGHVS